MEKEYTYSAFISYSSKDEKVAKALWKKLEHYRLPSVLQKQYEDIPEKMHVFLDQGDIVPGDTVENALSRELADSRKLIVICSPNSAKSPYVELEVKNFLALGHSPNDIIPYIIEGEVNHESPNNCYVPSLFGKTDKETINGVSLLRDGKWKAFVGVLANLLDVKFDEIYKREKVRKNRLIASVGFLGTIAACFLGIFIWYITPHTKCYNDYSTKWGIPVGFGKARKQFGATYYEITYQFGKPIKLVHKNAWGFVTSHGVGTEQQNRPRIAEYHYNHLYFPSRNMKKWQLSYVDCNIDANDGKNFNEQHMQMVYEWTDENNSNIRFYYDKERSVPKTLYNDVLTYQNLYYDDISDLLNGIFIGQNDMDMPDIKFLVNSSNIYCHHITYNEEGYETVITFYNYAGQVATDKNKIYGFLRSYNHNGQLIREDYQYDGISFNQLYKVIEYDECNEISKIAFYKQNRTVAINKEPELIINKSRNYAYSKNESKRDAKGRLLEYKCFYYDENDLEIEEKYDGIKSQCLIIDYDKNEFNQKSHKKTGDEEIFVSYKKEGDNLIEKVTLYNNDIFQYKAIKKSNSEGKDIYYSFNFENPENNYEINIFYEKKEDAGLSIKQVFSSGRIYEAVYDKYGRHIKDTRDANNKLISVELIYDGFNKHIYYFKDNKPYSDFTGFAQADFSYHSTGVLQNVIYRDENGKKTNHGFVFKFAEYDAVVTPHGLIRHQEFRDKNGNIVTSEYHRYAIFEGDSGSKDLFLTEGKYLLPDGRRALKADYCFEQCEYPYPESFEEPEQFVIRYYDQNNLTRRYRIFDALGKQKYTIIFSYDSNENIDIIINDSLGRVICGERRNKAGKHINKEDKDYSIMKFTYLPTGERIVETIDETGFVTTKLYDDKYGNAAKMYSYNKDNTYCIANYKENETEHVWYNANNEICKKVLSKYAEDGSCIKYIDNVTEEINVIAYYDKNNCLKNTEEGWAKKRTEKNTFGNEVIYYFNDEDNFLPYISNCICYVTEIDGNDELEFDIKVDDYVLQLGFFSFFENSVFDFSLNSEADLDSDAIFYRPSTKQIICYRYGDIPVITARVKQPCETIEKSEKYISDIKKIYEKWKKSNKSISD